MVLTYTTSIPSNSAPASPLHPFPTLSHIPPPPLPPPPSCAHAKRAIGSGQSAALPLGAAPSSDTVHHFWSEGLAITAVADLVDEIEIFGDSHPFHQRALGQQLMPGISFGAERVQARHARNACSVSVSELGPVSPARALAFLRTASPFLFLYLRVSWAPSSTREPPTRNLAYNPLSPLWQVEAMLGSPISEGPALTQPFSSPL